jgi:pyridinium-3,5-bisthiocarboxylic acid mononucleotide nickel chelatase
LEKQVIKIGRTIFRGENMRSIIIDPIGGVSGDMLLAGLIHAGCPEDYLLEVFRSLDIGPFRLHTQTDSINGISCLGLKFEIPDSHEGRTYASIRDEILPGLPDMISEKAGRIFRVLAEAESGVHGCTVEDVHFHEVGAVDSILDIVGISAALERMDIQRVYARPIPLGSGLVNSLHGKIPVPAPATISLLEGRKVRFTPLEAELTTPTGAAVIRTLAEPSDPPSDLMVRAVGYGCGTRRFPDWPNLCRVILCEEEVRDKEDLHGYMVEADIDDMPAEDLEAAVGMIMDAGARDVTMTPRIMKRGRPGTGIKAICDGTYLHEVMKAILLHTSTIGVRYYAVERSILPRRFSTLVTRFGEVAMKEVTAPDGKVRAKPEFRDLREISRSNDIPMGEVRAEVARALAGEKDTGEEP